MVKKVVLAAATAAFVFGGGAALAPQPAHALFWTKDTAGKVWSQKADKKARWVAKMAGKADKKAGKPSWWHAHWAAKKSAKRK